MRGLARGLKVLQIIHAQARPLALHDLFLATGVSKPSLLRILATLEAHHMVYRGLDDGRYRRGAPFDGAPESGPADERVIATAAPVLERLCARVKWPVDLALRNGDQMELRDSTRVRSPFHMRRILSAAGRAYLAFAPKGEKREILRRLEAGRDECVREFIVSGRMRRVLEATRRRGYGERDPVLAQLTSWGKPAADRTWGISVPLQGRERVYGCINLIWMLGACSTSAIATRHLDDLQHAAAEIVAELEPAERQTRRASGAQSLS